MSVLRVARADRRVVHGIAMSPIARHAVAASEVTRAWRLHRRPVSQSRRHRSSRVLPRPACSREAGGHRWRGPRRAATRRRPRLRYKRWCGRHRPRRPGTASGEADRAASSARARARGTPSSRPKANRSGAPRKSSTTSAESCALELGLLRPESALAPPGDERADPERAGQKQSASTRPATGRMTSHEGDGEQR